ncbi:hypothetical protein K3495_g464 [Podosphaera aphanis]|nr:hypothetical protein K3495_g464 [Podosphaera aphanis]
MTLRSATGNAAVPSNFASNRSRLAEAVSIITHGGLSHESDSNPSSAYTSTPEEITTALGLYSSQFLAGQPRSLCGIALRSFALGTIFSLSLALTIGLLYQNNPIWRVPFFLSTLSFFHFLEFWTTARANANAAKISSFLLTSNGAAYNIAHSCALLEMIVTHFYFAHTLLIPWAQNLRVCLGLLFIIIGQSTRTAAMLTAGPSFSHLVVNHKHDSHILIKHGIYRFLRHPSYLGFFWWGIGTQLICGNTISLIGYGVVLYWFFKTRIAGEEKLLVKFFGQEYVDYSKRTIVGIPGLG